MEAVVWVGPLLFGWGLSELLEGHTSVSSFLSHVPMVSKLESSGIPGGRDGIKLSHFCCVGWRWKSFVEAAWLEVHAHEYLHMGRSRRLDEISSQQSNPVKWHL